VDGIRWLHVATPDAEATRPLMRMAGQFSKPLDLPMRQHGRIGPGNPGLPREGSARLRCHSAGKLQEGQIIRAPLQFNKGFGGASARPPRVQMQGAGCSERPSNGRRLDCEQTRKPEMPSNRADLSK